MSHNKCLGKTNVHIFHCTKTGNWLKLLTEQFRQLWSQIITWCNCRKHNHCFNTQLSQMSRVHDSFRAYLICRNWNQFLLTVYHHRDGFVRSIIAARPECETGFGFEKSNGPLANFTACTLKLITVVTVLQKHRKTLVSTVIFWVFFFNRKFFCLYM